jgi:hypothetical protein
MKNKTTRDEFYEKFVDEDSNLKEALRPSEIWAFIEAELDKQRKEIIEENEDDQVSWEGFESGLF